MKHGANAQVQRLWKLRLFGFYFIWASILPVENVRPTERAAGLTSLNRGTVSFRGGGRRQQLLAVGRHQREWSDRKDRLKSRVDKIVSTILSKMDEKQRNMPVRSARWVNQSLNCKQHDSFLRALLLTELHSKALVESLSWTLNAHEQLQHIYAGWDQWSTLVNKIDQEPDQNVRLKQLKFKARQCQNETELEIIQTVIEDLAQYLAELGIEPIEKP